MTITWEDIRAKTAEFIFHTHILVTEEVESEKKKKQKVKKRKNADEKIVQLLNEYDNKEEEIVRLLNEYNNQTHQRLVKISGLEDFTALKIFNDNANGKTMNVIIDSRAKKWAERSSKKIIEPLKRMEHVRFLIEDEEHVSCLEDDEDED